MPSHTFVLIHGLFMTRRSWAPWVERLEQRGHRAVAVAWPGRDRHVEDLQANPDPNLVKLRLEDVIEHCATVVRGLDAPPVIVGHSMGGLITQILLQRGLGAAGIAIHSAPPRGVVTLKPSFLKANAPVLNPFISAREPYMMPFEKFQYAFVNGMETGVQRAIYEEQAVPESLVAARGALGNIAMIDFAAKRAPLLLLAGGADNIIPAGLNRSNAKKYRVSPSVTDFHEFPGRNHYTLGAPGWEEVADYVADWANQQATATAVGR